MYLLREADSSHNTNIGRVTSQHLSSSFFPPGWTSGANSSCNFRTISAKNGICKAAKLMKMGPRFVMRKVFQAGDGRDECNDPGMPGNFNFMRNSANAINYATPMTNAWEWRKAARLGIDWTIHVEKRGRNQFSRGNEMLHTKKQSERTRTFKSKKVPWSWSHTRCNAEIGKSASANNNPRSELEGQVYCVTHQFC